MSSSSCECRLENHRYPPFVLATNAGLEMLRDVRIDGIRPPSELKILAHTSDPVTIRGFHGSPMTATRRRPDVIITSLRSARSAARKPCAPWTDIATKSAQTRPNASFHWYDVFISFEIKSLRQKINREIQIPREMPAPSKQLTSNIINYFKTKKRCDPPVHMMSGSMSKRLKMEQFTSTQPAIPEHGDGTTSNGGFVSKLGTPPSASNERSFANVTDDLHGRKGDTPPLVAAGASATSADYKGSRRAQKAKNPPPTAGTNPNTFHNKAGVLPQASISASGKPSPASGSNFSLQKEDTSLQAAIPSREPADADGISRSENFSSKSVASEFSRERTSAVSLGSSADEGAFLPKVMKCGVFGSEMLSGSFGVLRSFVLYIEGMLLKLLCVGQGYSLCYRRHCMDLVLR